MLKIINNLGPFFGDCYRRISVREYAKIIKVSPPTASKLLKSYYKEGLLAREKVRNYLFFHTNNKSKQFIDFSRTYWSEKLRDLLDYLEKKLTSPTIILFGSLAKAEAKNDSDIDKFCKKIVKAKLHNQWLILILHDVYKNPREWDVSVEHLNE